MKGGSKVIVEKHRHEGIFVSKGKEEALLTLNLVPGETVYGEKRISVEVRCVALRCVALRCVALLQVCGCCVC